MKIFFSSKKLIFGGSLFRYNGTINKDIDNVLGRRYKRGTEKTFKTQTKSD